MDKAIAIVQMELGKRDREYSNKNSELYQACKFGTPSEQRKLKKEANAIWEKRQIIADLLIELKKANNGRDDQADFAALLGAFGR
jgi:hypothetical protein